MSLGHARELCESWRVRQFEYSWLHTAAGAYRDFHAVTEDALAYAARAHGINLSADASRTLVAVVRAARAVAGFARGA